MARLDGDAGVPSEELGQLYTQLAPGLQRFLHALLGSESDAADCLQECFAILVVRGESCVPAARKAWLYTVARNQAALLIRRRVTGRRVAEGSQAGQPTVVADVAEMAMAAERQRQVRAAVEQLPAEQREVVHLRIDEDLTFNEISQRLQIPLGTALSRMRAALKRLAQGLDEAE